MPVERRSAGSFISGTQIEIVSETIALGTFKHVLFDFDGTISLIRQGWQQVMIPLMVEILSKTPRAESVDEIRCVVADFVALRIRLRCRDVPRCSSRLL